MINQHYQKAKEIQEKYFRTGKINSEEVFDYYWNKSQVYLIRSFGEQNPKIKKRLERKWRTSYSMPWTLAVQNFYRGLAESHKRYIESTEQLIESRKKSNLALIELGAMDYPL